jgi:hypothetical protein
MRWWTMCLSTPAGRVGLALTGPVLGARVGLVLKAVDPFGEVRNAARR